MIRRCALALGSFAIAAVGLALSTAADGCFPTYEFQVPEAGPDAGGDADATPPDADAGDAGDAP
jgi:hypothetical protein